MIRQGLKLLVLILALLLIVGMVGYCFAGRALASTGSPDADGHREKCTVGSEFARISTGSPKLRVKRTFDTRGSAALPMVGDEIYDDLDSYGVKLPRLSMKHREVRTYPVCMDGHAITEGIVKILYDNRTHRVVVAEWSSSGYARFI